MAEQTVHVERGRRQFWSAAVTAVNCGLAAAVLLVLLGSLSGQISENGGLGFDGAYYALMIEQGFASGTPSMQLRPIVLLINDVVDDHVLHDVITTFRVMNVVYAFALAVVLADLCRRYGASRAATATLIVNVFLCISTAKMFAFYPVLVDLGAYAFMAATVWAMVAGHRVPIVLTSVIAVLSREFAAATIFFGIVRDLRTRRSIPVVAATYAPAALAFVAIRQFARTFGPIEDGPPVLAIRPLLTAVLRNTSWWADPKYALFWLYFAMTLFGGISLFLLTVQRPWRKLREEPEWLAFAAPLVAITALGYTDMWRYGAFLLPALPAFWAWSVSDAKPRRGLLLFASVTLVTLATQRPWQRMDMESYFRDWFPYYVVVEDGPDAGMYLWPVWTYYLPIAIVSFVALAVIRRATLSVRAEVTVPSAVR